MKKLLYIFLFLPVFAPAQVQMFFTSDSSAFITSPLDVDSLFYWFDASQGVFDSVGAVISNNQGVGEWKDLSGNGHHVTQGTNGARPQYMATGGPNNYPALYFDGSNDFLASAAHLWESDDYTSFVVLKFQSATRNAAEVVYARRSSTTTRQIDMFWEATALNYRSMARNWQDGTANKFVEYRGENNQKNTAYQIKTFVATGTSTGNQWYRNGATETTTRVVGGDLTATDGVYNLSAKTDIGALDTGSGYAGWINGYISEIIVYSRALTTAEREGVEAYLNHKYKLF